MQSTITIGLSDEMRQALDSGAGLQSGEERRICVAELRVQGGGDTEPTRISGHFALFDSWSEDLGGFREKIQRGAFKRTIKEDDVRALFNHSPDLVLGRNKSGTLKLEEDREGLRAEIDPPATRAADDLMLLIQRGDVDQGSFGFRTREDAWREPDEPNGLHERTLVEVELFDVSPVTFPAYPATDVGVRSLARFVAEHGRTHAIRRAARDRHLRLIDIA